MLNDLCRLVFPHAFAEEVVLWPALRRRLADGEQLTLEVEKEHQAINELFTSLEKLGVDSPEHHRLFDEIVHLLREDVRDEEDVLLPRLQQACTREDLIRLGTYWQAVRSTAPTRPHPVVARRPPGNALSALPLTVLDRSRDLLDAAARTRRTLVCSGPPDERAPRGRRRSRRAPTSPDSRGAQGHADLRRLADLRKLTAAARRTAPARPCRVSAHLRKQFCPHPFRVRAESGDQQVRPSATYRPT
ncbi:hemerythrin domain-containing protein [Gordonia paraffinivorans]|uniref:hemerythrin domain-containing protein n=1 Tax=Gordonia paraffinivorans TaxID=175628 RepID=UPI003FCD4878